MSAPTNPHTIYTEDVVEQICQYITEGMSIREISTQEGMPCETTIFNWLKKDKNGFVVQYAHAKSVQAHIFVDEIIAIADDGTNDYMKKSDPENPGYQLNGEHVQRSKLRIDVRKWAASKYNAKVYGDRLHQEIMGKDGEPIRHSIETIKPSDAKKLIEDLQKS